MQYGVGTLGRIFVLRLEEGERLPDVIEAFAREQGLREALVFYLGGAQDGSRLVVGPEENRGDAIVPMVHILKGIQEVVGVGTLFPNDAGAPILHLHAATGREGPGPLVASLATDIAAVYTVPVTIVPGGLSADAIDAIA